MSHVDFETEPLPGLPALPPDGEQILWQGSPRWQTVARRILHIDVLAIYFVLLLAWRIERGVNGGASAEQIATTAAWCVGFAALALGVLTWIARAIGRTTIYTITSNRVAWRHATDDGERRRILVLFALNAALNLLWSLLFFRLKRPDWALFEVGALWLSIAALMLTTAAHSRLAPTLLFPYLACVTFAAYLN